MTTYYQTITIEVEVTFSRASDATTDFDPELLDIVVDGKSQVLDGSLVKALEDAAYGELDANEWGED